VPATDQSKPSFLGFGDRKNNCGLWRLVAGWLSHLRRWDILVNACTQNIQIS
jgi:hypothetical protein